MSQILLLILALTSAYILIRPIIRGACYFPSHPKIVEKYIRLAQLRPGSRIVDLGSGDGRVLIRFAQAGFEAHGFEINPLLVFWSIIAAKLANCGSKISVRWRSFWKEDLSGYDAVIIYGFPHIMGRLGEKLKREVRPGVPIISNNYVIPGWQPVKEDSGLILYYST